MTLHSKIGDKHGYSKSDKGKILRAVWRLPFSPSLSLARRGKDVTALRCSEPLRYKVGGGHQSPRHGCAGWDRLGVSGDTTSTALDVFI